MTFAVIVGTKPTDSTPQPDLAGFHVHGPFVSRSAAQAFATEVNVAFRAAKAEHGDKAFPYGEPWVEVVQIRRDAIARAAFAVRNWVFDPDLEDEV